MPWWGWVLIAIVGIVLAYWLFVVLLGWSIDAGTHTGR